MSERIVGFRELLLTALVHTLLPAQHHTRRTAVAALGHALTRASESLGDVLRIAISRGERIPERER
jgi:hypothetical protein